MWLCMGNVHLGNVPCSGAPSRYLVGRDTLRPRSSPPAFTPLDLLAPFGAEARPRSDIDLGPYRERPTLGNLGGCR